MKTRFALLLIAIALAGCDGREETRGGLSAEEERRLDNIAKTLDEGVANLSFDAPAAGNASGGTAGNRQ